MLKLPADLRVVLFDLDDTLYDHYAAARAATALLVREHDVLARAGADAVFVELQRILEELHRGVALGTLDVDSARRQRWQRVLRHFGASIDDASRLAGLYREFYLAAEAPVAGAVALLERCRARGLQLGILSNNTRGEQLRKLNKLGLTPYFSGIVVSADHGLSKPDARLFQIALAELNAQREHTLMLGDSWENDVCGAVGAGIAAVWFKRSHVDSPARAAGTEVAAQDVQFIGHLDEMLP